MMSTKKFVSRKGETKINDFVARIDCLIELIGIDYIGIGTDFGGSTSGLVKGLKGCLVTIGYRVIISSKLTFNFC